MSSLPTDRVPAEAALDKVPSDSSRYASLDEKLSKSDPEEIRSSDSDDAYVDKYDKGGHRGVMRISAINRILNTYGTIKLFGRDIHTLRITLLFFLFLQGYVTGLDGNMSMAMQQPLISIFGHNGDTSAVTTVKSVIASAVFIPYARLSDRVGRMEIWLAALAPFLAGRIATAATPTFAGLFAGVVVEEFGYAAFRFLSGILPSDISSLKDHTFTINIYELPEIINFWAGSYISQSLIGAEAKEYQQHETQIRWGFGMFTILVPFTTVLLASVYLYAQFVSYRRKELPSLRNPDSGKSFARSLYDLLKELDIVGVILYTTGMVLLFLALSLGGGKENEWHSVHIIVMIVIGGALIPIWVVWEMFFATSPILPKRYFGTTFASAILIMFFVRASMSTLLGQGRTNLLIAYGQSTQHTQWLSSMVLFVGAIVNLVMGIILHYWPHPKFFIMTGGYIFLLGVGLFVKYRVDYFDSGIHGYVGALVIMGLGAAFIRYPLWTLVQASVPHKDMASAIGLLMSAYQIGASVGSCLASAIWQNTILKDLLKYVGPIEEVTYVDPKKKELVSVPGKKFAMRFFQNPNKLMSAFKQKNGKEVHEAVLKAYEHGNWVTAVVSVALAGVVAVLVFLPFPYDIVTENETISEEKRKEEECKFSDGRKSYILRFFGI